MQQQSGLLLGPVFNCFFFVCYCFCTALLCFELFKKRLSASCRGTKSSQQVGVYRQKTQLPTDAPQRRQQQRRHPAVSLLQARNLLLLLLLLFISLLFTAPEAGGDRP